MHAIPQFFTATRRPGIGSRLVDGSEVHFRSLRLERARKLWEDGAEYLHITDAGARQLYKDQAPEHLVRLLDNACKTLAEVDAIARLKPRDKAVKTAAQNRVQQLTATPEPKDLTPSTAGVAGGMQSVQD